MNNNIKPRLSLSITLCLAAVLSIYQAEGQIIPAVEDSLTAAHITTSRWIGQVIHTVSREEVRAVISPTGEPDIFKYIQTLPGISSGMEGTSSFYARGSNMGNNLISLDGVTIYGPTHLMGLAAILPNEIIDNTDICLGGFDATDGNLLASHIRMHSRCPDTKSMGGSISISNLMASGSLRTPVIKNKVSFIGNFRFSPIQWEYNAIVRSLIRPEMKLPEHIQAGVGDIYGKIHWKQSRKSSFNLSCFHSGDSYRFSNNQYQTADYLGWQNLIVLADWQFDISPAWTISTSASFNRFLSRQEQSRTLNLDNKADSIAIFSSIQEWKWTSNATFRMNRWKLLFGAEHRNSYFQPGSAKNAAEAISTTHPDEHTMLSTLFAQIEYDSLTSFYGKAGVRVNRFSAGSNYVRWIPEIRLSAQLALASTLCLEMSFDYLAQFYHSLEGIPTGLSLDMLVPSGEFAEPERSVQFYAGIHANPTKNIQLSAAGFYKRLSNLVYFKEADKFFSSTATDWKKSIEMGSGIARGIELSGQGRSGRSSCQVSYTLSKADRIFPTLNEGQAFPFKFDRRHILSVSADHLLARKKVNHLFKAFFTLSSGHYETLQAGTYPAWNAYPFSSIISETLELKYFTHPNNYRLPPYIRLDIAYNLHWSRSRAQFDLTAGICNVMNRHNAYSLTWDPDAQQWKKLSILPLMPNLNFTVSF